MYSTVGIHADFVVVGTGCTPPILSANTVITAAALPSFVFFLWQEGALPKLASWGGELEQFQRQRKNIALFTNGVCIIQKTSETGLLYF